MPSNAQIVRVRHLETCSREMFGEMVVTCQTSPIKLPAIPLRIPIYNPARIPAPLKSSPRNEQRRTSDLVEELLVDIYTTLQQSPSSSSRNSRQSSVVIDSSNIHKKDVRELRSLVDYLSHRVERSGDVLLRQLKRRDALRRQQDAHCDVITCQLLKRSECTDMRFALHPAPGDSGFAQWLTAMKMVAQLPEGIPGEFRRRLWLTLADRHLTSRRLDWSQIEKNCFSEWSHPADSDLGVQIVKDLHRTGCSLFCGEDGQENQALLKRVLLAYARWNKAVGYCQGFNMLAALILQVTDRCESDTLKLMIYLIEGVLPDSYFADSLRGLSVDMAVFRELLRVRLPRLSKHLDTLQNAPKEGTSSYEPPLTNVFTMQWFLTLFCNCLPQPTVLRVWDLILLEGNEILLRTALAIWKTLADRILRAKNADEFYCLMGVLTRELLEFELINANSLINTVVTIGPLTELRSLREHYLYNITPWGTTLPIEKQLKLYPKDRLVLDISTLKKQYAKLKLRQRQAHIIFNAAISRQTSTTTPVAVNHLLLGKNALVPAKRLGPPKGSIPPSRSNQPTTLHWKDTPKPTDSSSSSDTELCDDPSSSSDDEAKEPEKLPADNPEPAKLQSNAASSTVVLNESDDDFERFLEDRVQFLKDSEVGKGEEPDRLTFGRRNSELALQIIQENSMILHRIMQCQSRLSPTLLPQESKSSQNSSEEEEEAAEYVSKYSSILEKSKNLDEKFNSLIVNGTLPQLSKSTGGEASQSDETDSKSDGSKSPTFNPFPVSVSSRQNKEVPLKLGLYKK